jgi:spectinomycin phosphotransferase
MPPAANLEDAVREHCGEDVLGIEPIEEGEESLCHVVSTATRRYFVKLQGADEIEWIEATLDIVRQLEVRSCSSLIAPVPSRQGGQLTTLADGSLLHVYPFVERQRGVDLESPAVRRELGRVIGNLHACGGPDSFPGARVDTLEDWLHDDLEELLTAPAPAVSTTPDVADVFLALRASQQAVRAGTRTLNSLYDGPRHRGGRLVMTHGDLTPGNVIVSDGGRIYLVDWSSAHLARPERDLVQVSDQALADFLLGYREEAPVDVDRDCLLFYLCRWPLEAIHCFGRRMLEPGRDERQRRHDAEIVRRFLPFDLAALEQRAAAMMATIETTVRG